LLSLQRPSPVASSSRWAAEFCHRHVDAFVVAQAVTQLHCSITHVKLSWLRRPYSTVHAYPQRLKVTRGMLPDVKRACGACSVNGYAAEARVMLRPFRLTVHRGFGANTFP
jgi:hypothetical protein